MFILSVYQYLRGANVEYLDLEAPANKDIVCKLPRDECRDAKHPVTCMVLLEDTRFWRGMNLSDPCPALPSSLSGQSCRNPTLPLSSIMGDLASLRTVNNTMNPFKLWSVLFLVLMSLLSLCIVIHDLALLEERLRPRILSLPNMRYGMPLLWKCLKSCRCRRPRNALWRFSRVLWVLVVPFWALFQAVAFMGLVYPFSLLMFVVAPVAMSRVMVFLSAILCMMWSIVFVIVMGLFDAQVYAVLWAVPEPVSNQTCLCLCQYPLTRSVVIRVILLGVGVCWHSFNLTLRALKGLRRGQWANMFSVLYAVPVEVFPVVWHRPEDEGGGPVRGRKEGEPVQDEPAFDPFCLMDEQPRSAWTRALILPVALTEQQRMGWEPYTGTLDTKIGCCGFPTPYNSGGNDEPSSPWPGSLGTDASEAVASATGGHPEPAIFGSSLSFATANGNTDLMGTHMPSTNTISRVASMSVAGVGSVPSDAHALSADPLRSTSAAIKAVSDPAIGHVLSASPIREASKGTGSVQDHQVSSFVERRPLRSFRAPAPAEEEVKEACWLDEAA